MQFHCFYYSGNAVRFYHLTMHNILFYILKRCLQLNTAYSRMILCRTDTLSDTAMFDTCKEVLHIFLVQLDNIYFSCTAWFSIIHFRLTTKNKHVFTIRKLVTMPLIESVRIYWIFVPDVSFT